MKPCLLVTLTPASLSNSSDTASTCPPTTASIRGVLQTTRMTKHVTEVTGKRKRQAQGRDHSLSLRVSSIDQLCTIGLIQQEAHTRCVTVHHWKTMGKSLDIKFNALNLLFHFSHKPTTFKPCEQEHSNMKAPAKWTGVRPCWLSAVWGEAPWLRRM